MPRPVSGQMDRIFPYGDDVRHAIPYLRQRRLLGD
jgi:hypothetical protein